MSHPQRDRFRFLLVLGALSLLPLLGGCRAPVHQTDAVRVYVDDAVEILDRGLYANTPEWAAAVERIVPQLYEKETAAETFYGLSELAEVAGGRHTFLMSPGSAALTASQYGADAGFPVPTVATTEGVSTVVLPTFGGQQQAAIDRYQDAGIDALRSAAPETTCGWIVDVRGNGGGNAYPMLSSIAPLLRDGHVLGFRDRDGDTAWVDVENGNIRAPAEYDIQSAVADFTLDQPVAILTGPMSASAAETVVVALAGQADTQRVGEPTAGYTTANEAHELSDGAVLALTIAYYVDRDGNVYDGPISPDISHDSTSATALDAATAWVRSRC